MALIFVQSGFGKLLDIDGFTASLAGKGVPLAGIFGVIGPCVEFFGGLAVLLGLQSRYADEMGSRIAGLDGRNDENLSSHQAAQPRPGFPPSLTARALETIHELAHPRRPKRRMSHSEMAE